MRRELFIGLVTLTLAGLALWLWLDAGPLVPLTAAATYLVMAVLIGHFAPEPRRGLGWANRVTLVRGMLVALLAGTLAEPDLLARHAVPFAGLALLVLALDGVDGWVARRTGTTTAFGARFDMEVDALLILVLCLALVALDKAGPWVLGIGAMRYSFVMAGAFLPWLRAPLPESLRRKAVCVWQVAALMLGLLPAVGPAATTWLAATALAGLIGSFSVDVGWLYRHARA
jgi:phosphatidylglycerophosphate synthase